MLVMVYINQLCFPVLIHCFWLATNLPGISSACEVDEDCGWNSYCHDGSCECLEDFSLSTNNVDCIDTRCSDPLCVLCAKQDQCMSCVDFIEENTGRCLSSCDTQYSLVTSGPLLGKVCTEHKGRKQLMYVGIIISLCAASVFTVLLSFVCYFKLRTDKEKFLRTKLLSRIGKHYQFLKGPTTAGNRTLTGSDDMKPRPEKTADKKNAVLERLEALRLHKDMLATMVREAEHRAQALPHDDHRIPVFSESDVSLPPDSLYLLQWASRLLHEYNRQRAHQAADCAAGSHPKCAVSPSLSSLSSGQSLDYNLTTNHSNRVKMSGDKVGAEVFFSSSNKPNKQFSSMPPLQGTSIGEGKISLEPDAKKDVVKQCKPMELQLCDISQT